MWVEYKNRRYCVGDRSNVNGRESKIKGMMGKNEV